ncbi:uncharacterized protein LOC123658065 [Melitaea cinxia]|uniref:uncharacterized protein LOC123658065 n=1 Tax=Melitaea cinxia TaxID=113334 RepID=UPI001E273816|nr:uncharacterized protein LOC123658065 [Melitaea cinxia]
MAKLSTTAEGKLLYVIESYHNHPPPELFRTSDDDVKIQPSRSGKGLMLIYKGHTYKHMTSRTRWYCSKKFKGCPAKLSTTADGKLLQVFENVVEVQPSKSGKGLMLIYGGHTYRNSKNGMRWHCSQKPKKCPAKLTATTEGKIIYVIESNHNHPQPVLCRGNDGKYVSVKMHAYLPKKKTY